MKQYLKCKISLVFVVMAILFQSQLFAQTPTNGIIFQAVARDQYSNPAKDRKIFVQSSIIQSTVSGIQVLIEEYETNTDASGVFSIGVGNGKRIGGTVSSLGLIDWAQGPYFLNLKIAIKPIAPVTGWDYTKDLIDLGTSPFGTVPYALYAGNVFGLDKKLNIADSSKYVTPAQLNAKTFDQTPILSSIATKLNIADSLTKYVTPTQLASKTFDSTAIYNQLGLKANTLDINASLALKANTVDVNTALALKENVENRSTNLTVDGSSNTKYPTVKSVKDYVDLQVASSIATIVDASPTVKGKIQLSGDLTGTAALPTIANNAVTTVKIADGNITNAKLSTGIDATKITGDITGKASNVTGTIGILNGGTGANSVAAARSNLGLAIGTDVQAPLSFTSPIVKNANTVSIGQATTSTDGYLSATDFTSFNNKIDATQKAANNGVATLGNDGKIPSNQIPAISFQSAVVVNGQPAMLALSSAVVGSIAIRTDLSKNFVLSASPSSTLSNWIELATPSSVTSVNGSAGPNVVLTTNEIAEGATNKYFTDARVRSALNASSPLSFNASTGAFSMSAASTSNNGYLASSDFTTFNNKQNALIAGTDYLPPNGSAIALTNFPTLNQNTTGNAATATKLAAPKNINGVPFDGSVSINIDADANTLTGNILASNITSSSLTGVGTITSGAWSGTTIAIAKGGTGATTATGALTNLGAEPAVNKSNDVSGDGSSTTKFPSVKAIKDYVDLQSANAGVADNSLTSAKINGTISITKGGTGASTAAAARTNLGLAIGTDVMAANYTTTLTGDVTGSGNGSFATTINSVGGVSSSTIATLPTTVAANTASITSNTNSIAANTISITANTTAITAEATTARAAEQALTTSVNANTVSITANTTAITAEATTARAAEQTLTTNVAANTASITANTTAITAEATTARAVEQTLTTNVAANTASITANTTAITAEATTARAAEQALTTSVNANTVSITSINSTLSTKANLASPALTGVPTAPTTLTSDNSTAIATTEYVKANLATVSAGTLTGTTLASTITGSSLTSVGTIISGTWSGTTIALANGGTGATNAADGRTNLGAEAVANKSTATDLGASGTSDVLFPSQKAVKTYVDLQVAAAGVADGSITNAKLAGSIAASKLIGTDITTVGTITTGVWSGTAIAIANGGTGTTTVLGAKTNLGLNNVENTALSTWAGSANITTVGSLSAMSKTFTFQDLILGYGTSQGKISTDGGKSIQFYPTYNVESTRFWPNGNVTIQHGGSYTDNGYTLEVGGTSNFIGNSNITGDLNVTGNITGATWSGTTIPLTKGGTGAITAVGARTNLGLVIGTDVMAANFTTTLTGDVTGAGNGSFATTLANSGVSSGSYGSSTAIPTFTVDSKGRLTAASTVGIIAGVNTLNYTSSTAYAAGGTISGTSLTLAAADGTNPGLISTGAQTIAGAKTFSSAITGNLTGNATTATTAGNITATSNTTLTSLSNLATVGTITTGTWSGSVIGSNVGGAGTVSGLMKANGTGVVSAAVAGTDYQMPYTNLTNIGGLSNSAGYLKNVGSGTFTYVGSITDADLSTIATAGKVSNTATSATSSNTANAIVSRDASGNFTAGTITAALTGNASTATTLATARNINGTAFNGSADITIIADAGTLSGTALKSTVTGSSLTGVGTITSGTWNGSTIGVAYGGTGVTSSTGTGSVVLSNTPTLVTPNLGTPASATLTNATGLPIATGVSGLGTGIASFLATPTSSNLLASMTDETGTGSLVFATSPTLVTPNIGAANGTSLSLTGNLSAAAGTFSSTLSAGATSLNSTLGVTGATSLSSLTVSGTSILTALTTTGAATFSSTVKIPTNAGLNKVLISDASGNATWNANPSASIDVITTATAVTPYSVDLTKKYIIYNYTTAESGKISIPLAASSNLGTEIIIKNKSGNTITVTPLSSGTIYIDNSITSTTSINIGIEASNNWVKLVSDGSQWVVFRALF